MKYYLGRLSVCLALLLLVVAGCSEVGGEFGGDWRGRRGGVRQRHAQEQQERDSDRGRRAEENYSAADEAPREEDSGRELGERLPSRTEQWDRERPRPSDSMPSDRGGWGSERRMPSDSMPSRSERWNSDRPASSNAERSDARSIDTRSSDAPARDSFREPLPSESE